ncbi:hypothetical protein MMC08_004692 [Hypocenomyce scalaris]|nr:hypothetical protein [Hypocenomyce scalaris]
MSKHILVTGAARGIGRCTARYFLQKGHKVFLLDAHSEELEHTTKVHLKPHAGNYASTLCNLRDPADIRKAISRVSEFFDGHLDLLVNNGGIANPQWLDGKTMEDVSLEEWNAYIETNITAAFLVSQACIPLLKADKAKGREDGGSIIHISSYRGRQSEPNSEGYGTTKAGVLGLTHSMAASAGIWNIRVNAILPGWISVQNECKKGDEKGLGAHDGISDENHERHPAQRVGRGEDIAEAVEFLMGAGFISGHELVVDGGVSKLKYPTRV